MSPYLYPVLHYWRQFSEIDKHAFSYLSKITQRTLALVTLLNEALNEWKFNLIFSKKILHLILVLFYILFGANYFEVVQNILK